MDRRMKIALLASLIFNVFAVGVFAGHLMTGGQRPGAVVPRSIESPMRMMRYARELPPESKETFRAVLRTEIPELREKREALHELQRAYDTALRAQPWDRAAVDAALHDVQIARADIQTLMDKTFIDAVESLSPQDRELLRESERRHGRKHRRGRDHRDRSH